MGVTIHYRGTIDDISLIETLEDRVVDLVFSIGGRATIWRSFAEHDSSRVVRGLIVEMEPGQDTFSLLISPEGHLTPLFQIADAEIAPFHEPPYCFVKTQFGSPQGHVAIVHLLDALRQMYCSNLEVLDEGEYYENRDVGQLTRKLQSQGTAINAMTKGWKEYGLNQEAAEDPTILATRIERIAALVHQRMTTDQRQPTSPTGDNSTNDPWDNPSLEEEVLAIERLRRQSELRSERMHRRIAESTMSGMSFDDALEFAMQEEGLPIPRCESIEQNEPQLADEANEPVEPTSEQPWLESLPPQPFDLAKEESQDDVHPAVEQGQAFLITVMDLAKNVSVKSSFLSVLTRASMDIVGGLVQASCDDYDDITHRAMAISQLKRALAGHAYARGALCGLRSEEAITEDLSTQLHDELESLLATIHSLTEAAWENSGT